MDSDFGENELYDMVKDPYQTTDLVKDPAYADVIKELDGRLVAFFNTYSDPAYDLWKGGSARGSLSHPDEFRKRFGDDSQLVTEIKPAFEQ